MSANGADISADLKTIVIGFGSLAAFVVVVFLGLWALGSIIQAFETPEETAARKARIAAVHDASVKEAKARTEACAADVECATEGIKLDAMAACTRPVERLAKHSAEWIGGMTPKFAARDWKNGEKTVVVLSGAGIKFQNGFGAWQRYGYQCEYDIGKKAVVGVRAFPYSG